MQTPYPIKSPTYTGKIPEYQHYRYRQGQQSALASHRRTARYERIPPNGFDMAALEVMFHEEIPPALRATSLFKGGYFIRAPSWIGLLFQGRLFHRHLSLSPKQFPAPENISENFVKTIAIPNEMWYNKFCEPLHKACAAFPCIPSRLSRRLLCQKFSAYTPLCRACAHDIRQFRTKSVWRLCTPLFVSSDEKFDDASVAQSLCGIAIKTRSETRLWQVLIFVRAVPFSGLP